MEDRDKGVKTAIEIGSLAGQLSATNQAYVLNTINTLLFSQQVSKIEQPEPAARDARGALRGKGKPE